VKARLRGLVARLGSVANDDTKHHVTRIVNSRVDIVEDVVRHIDGRITELESRVSSDTQTATEFANSFRRSTDRLRSELASMWAWATAGVEPGLAELITRSGAGDVDADLELGKLIHDQLPGAADRVVGAHEGARLPIGPGTADFINWANGHTGPAAQAGVWVNQAINLFHHDGTVRLGEVNERIVEVPWVMGLATSLEPGSLVLDFGATESTVALSMAALGLDVIAADLRPYAFAHPRIQSVVGPIEQWEGPDRPLDAVTCVSALEHVGLGAYGETATAGDLDRQIVERFFRWLKPGGEIAFTAPYGQWQVDELQRVYDAEHLDALFAGWEITGRAICVQTGTSTWERVEEEPAWSPGEHGVVLLRARRP
jgi:2-polyprenyl-3-methyl-5-hydroxy-6-metoxy-1,4-benzoquinol methylase